jgi:hypothetical protein
MNDRANSERGASLIMVILFVTVFGIITAAILDFASTGFHTTETIAGIRTDLHTIDGATDGAVNAIRGSKKGLPSEGTCPTFTLAADGKEPAVSVECESKGASTGGIFDDQPAWALLTLGNQSSDYGIAKGGNFQTTVDGGVFSTKDITFSGGKACKKDSLDENCDQLNVVGDALALGICTPLERLKATGQIACSPTPVDASRGADPGYPTALSEAQVNALPVDGCVGPASCPTPDGTKVKCIGSTIVKFSPGVYTESLSNLVPAACNAATTWWLSPTSNVNQCSDANPVGVYYLNFEQAPLWTLGVSVVGGTLAAGCTGTGLPASTITFPTACDDTKPGVELIFGGKTQLVAPGNGQKLALCASGADPTVTNQHIAIYGLPTGVRTLVTNKVRSATASVTPTKFNNPGNAFAVGGGAATATISGDDSPKSATLTLKTYEGDTAGSPAVPLGARIESATIDMPYSTSSPVPVTMALSWAGSTATFPCPTTTAATGTVSCAITPALLGKLYAYNEINASALTVVASAPLAATVPPTCNKAGNNCSGGSAAQMATVNVDAMTLKVTYRMPGFEAHDRSVGYLFESQKTSPITIVRGTLYAPTADVWLEIQNKEATDFSRGVIVRNLNIDAIGNNISETSAISLPGFTGNPPRIVLFTAKVDGQTRLRARIRYIDKTPAGLDSAGYSVDVLDWEIVR